jgi:monoterpene epsilon-lactone hydrolase
VHHQAKARLVNCYAMWAELSASLDEPLCRRLLATEARQTIGSSYVPPCGEPLAAMLAIRDAGLPQPGCGRCISPWVDMEATGETMVSKSTVDPTVQKVGILDMARLYLNAADPRSPLAAPIYADLTGLAPFLIQVGAAETLLDDAIRLARVAGAADVRVDLQIWPEMIHVWHLFHPELKAGQRAIDEGGTFVRAHTAVKLA